MSEFKIGLIRWKVWFRLTFEKNKFPTDMLFNYWVKNSPIMVRGKLWVLNSLSHGCYVDMKYYDLTQEVNRR